MKVKLLVFTLLFTSCAVENYKPSKWDYMSPEHVSCEPKKQVKVCEQIGSRMLCECYLA